MSLMAKNSLYYDNNKNEKKRMVLGIKPGTSAPKKKKKNMSAKQNQL